MAAQTLSIARPGPIRAIRAGWEAFRRVPGLWRHVLVGMIVNYCVFGVLAAGAYFGLYSFIFKPISINLLEFQSADTAWIRLVAQLAAGLLWFTQGILLIACILLAFLIAVQLIGVWTDGLAARVVKYFRGTPPSDAQSVDLLPEARRTARITVVQGALGLLSFGFAFVPIVGPPITLLIFAYLLGWEVREPYLLAREAWGEQPDTLRRRVGAWTVLLGLPPAVLGVIPVLGWVLMPITLILAATGVAWAGEQARQTPPR